MSPSLCRRAALIFLFGPVLGQIHYASVLTGKVGGTNGIGLVDGDEKTATFNNPSALCGVSRTAAGSSCSPCAAVREVGRCKPPPLPPPTPLTPLE